MTGPRAVQRVENGLVAVLALTATAVLHPSWWWAPLAAFLPLDLSALGYLRSTAAGAASYNAVHTYAWPAVAAAVAVTTHDLSPALSTWSAVVAGTWAFHVGVDRALGYGLKLPDAVTRTHLGWIGGDRGQGS